MSVTVMAHYQVREGFLDDEPFKVSASEMENWDGTYAVNIYGRGGAITLFLDPAQIEHLHGVLAECLSGEGEA